MAGSDRVSTAGDIKAAGCRLHRAEKVNTWSRLAMVVPTNHLMRSITGSYSYGCERNEKLVFALQNSRDVILGLAVTRRSCGLYLCDASGKAVYG